MLTTECSYFILLAGKHLKPTHLLEGIHSCELQLGHGHLYIYYAVSYAAQFLASINPNNGLLNCILNTVEGVESVTALKCCLAEWLQE